MNHLATRLRYQLSSSNSANQSDPPSTKYQSDETLEDIKAIAELEPNGVISHSCFSSFYTNCINSIFRRCSLTRTSASLYKTSITVQFQKINTSHFHKKFQFVFLFLFCFARTSNDSFLIYAFENNRCSFT